MEMQPQEFNELLDRLKKNNGKLWIRILGQLQKPFNEACFWVLVEDAKQAADALKHLQGELKRPHMKYSERLTVSFTIKRDGKRYHSGFFVGDEIFKAESLLELEDPVEGEGDESPDIFDKTPLEWD